MAKIRRIIRTLLLASVATVQIFFYPAVALGQAPTTVSGPSDSSSGPEGSAAVAPAPEPCPEASPGITKPTGVAAHTYIFNENTCLWENDYYTWSPITKKTTPKTSDIYVYNNASGKWEKVEPKPPAQERVSPNEPDSVTDEPKAANLASPSSSSNDDQSLSSSSSIADTGPSSNNSVNNESATDGSFTLNTDGRIRHTLDSTAQSGDANVLQNTVAGDALSGDATVMANLINLLQSTYGGNLTTFSSDIQGDVFGDLLIDPSAIQSLLGSSGHYAYDDVDVTIANNGIIENNINLNAQSGGATVSGNTTVGSATSGSAHAVANIVNLMNTAIASGDSFLGVLNIHGNLNGDILLPEDFIDQLIASNAPTSTISTSHIEDSEFLLDVSNDHAITNNITTTASSGDASVVNNTVAGNAKSGDAETNITVFNLSNQQIIGANTLLVFVNVMGEWVGLIVDAPAGSTAAALGGGIAAQNTLARNINADITSTGRISNDVTVNAASGDATVSDNTKAGDATSGDATASANILNIAGSQLSLSDWFGVLFINVFGSWQGSFGIDTIAGDKPVPAAGAKNNTNAASRNLSPDDMKVFRFVPSDDSDKLQAQAVDTEEFVSQVASAKTATPSSSDQAVLASATESDTNIIGDETDGGLSLPLLSGFVITTLIVGWAVRRWANGY